MTRRLPTSSFRDAQGGFTLMELLTVIAIIAVLAALAVPLAGNAKAAKVSSRTQAELQQLQTAIESYKADKNAHPPDHLIATQPRRIIDPVINPLFYELRGMDLKDGVFHCKGDDDTFNPDQIEKVFGRRGFLNASADKSEPVRSYLDPKPDVVKRVTYNGVAIEVLASPFDWPKNAASPAPISGSTVNPWRYVSTSPTNNTGRFDLWVEVYVGKEKRLFKNW